MISVDYFPSVSMRPEICGLGPRWHSTDFPANLVNLPSLYENLKSSKQYTGRVLNFPQNKIASCHLHGEVSQGLWVGLVMAVVKQGKSCAGSKKLQETLLVLRTPTRCCYKT